MTEIPPSQQRARERLAERSVRPDGFDRAALVDVRRTWGASEIPPGAVEAIAERAAGRRWDRLSMTSKERYRKRAHEDLTAALPHIEQAIRADERRATVEEIVELARSRVEITELDSRRTEPLDATSFKSGVGWFVNLIAREFGHKED